MFLNDVETLVNLMLYACYFLIFCSGILGGICGYKYSERQFRYAALAVKTDRPLESEDDFVRYFNEHFFQGEVEYRLDDLTRIDIFTETLAIEVDFARKWYEAVGQAVHYAGKTGKMPAVILISTSIKDEKYISAAKEAISRTRFNGINIPLFIFRYNINQAIAST